jgi:hypothetical protein
MAGDSSFCLGSARPVVSRCVGQRPIGPRLSAACAGSAPPLEKGCRYGYSSFCDSRAARRDAIPRSCKGPGTYVGTLFCMSAQQSHPRVRQGHAHR